jgi:hypothetical protein
MAAASACAPAIFLVNASVAVPRFGLRAGPLTLERALLVAPLPFEEMEREPACLGFFMAMELRG